MSDQNSAFVFVGGVSHPPAIWNKAVKALAKLGHRATAVKLPTCSDDTTKVQDTKQWDEVDAIKDAITKFLDEGFDVVLVAHSYGGWPGSRAVKGLDKASRLAAGKTTGIVELVMMAAFVIPDNAEKETYGFLPPWLDIKDDCRRPNAACIPLLFNDIPEADAQYWLSKMQWQKNDLSDGVVPDAPWAFTIPKTYLITTDDAVFSPQMQCDMLKSVINSTWAVKSIQSGHSPFLSQPENLAKVLLQPSIGL